ncbi:NIPSNAP family protein [Rhodopirellula sp. JC639]|uniref:NIPSNAP family protein n=1 Tax=Stieleria mannarensis TaxID=2755585 RepID=UPI0015FF5391|nr:NIPSNAP family protein [Rhodopirellula sp. JC639]
MATLGRAATASLLTLFLFGFPVTRAAEPNHPPTKQHYEIRTYLLGKDGDAAAVDRYLQHALIPALNRIEIGPVGVFAPAENDTNDRDSIIVVIPADSADKLAGLQTRLQNDSQYLADAKPYLERGPKDAPYARISSEWLVAMDCMPTLDVPAGTLDHDDRVYELRLYESANERLGNLKVDMFNNGEVPIFLDSGIAPIFIGQAIVGPQTPNLTYLTVYPNDDARLKAWDAFRAHPDWQVLKNVAKYKGTVSKIDKHILVAKPYSQM